MQRSAIVLACELAIRLRRLLQRALVGVGDDKLQQRIVAPQASEIHLRQPNGCDLLLPQRDAELAYGGERPRFVGDVAAALHFRDDLRDVRRRAQPQRLLLLVGGGVVPAGIGFVIATGATPFARCSSRTRSALLR